ncbi:HDOD domain-containing protein [Psychrosphaera algicola]|uniref:HDOD domain-containing protein n=2 Tax=Psychrosphaera TaxID=907197 RepID=A0ABT5FH88_9GAMM|nr:HDOD domain-containing protein [Psychrosphaera sp. G1-22]MDC2890552.1 HDOD domain-containing protein [Psychrosphaera sp. G1-22]
MLSEKIALTRLGVYADRKQLGTARELLHIEEKALERKVKQQATETEFKEYVNEYFHEALFEYLDVYSNDKNYLFSQILTIDPNIPDVLDACVKRATTATQLDTLISKVTFLTRDILKMVNNPPFRAENSNKAHVDKIGLAVRYIGVDNVRFALLSYIGKNWLPHSTEPYNDFKEKFWQYSIATANCARTLAKYYKIDESVAFLLGLLHGIGMSMSLRLYLRAFDTVRVIQMKALTKANRKDIVKLVDTLTLDNSFVSEALRRFTPTVSHHVIERLGLKFAPILPTMEELRENVPFKQSSPMTRLLKQSQTFVQYKMLQKSRLIELDDAKVFLTQANINNDIITILNKVDLLKIDIRPQE